MFKNPLFVIMMLLVGVFAAVITPLIKRGKERRYAGSSRDIFYN